MELEDIVNDEMLTTEDVNNMLEHTDKGRTKQTIRNCVTVLQNDPVLKKAIKRNELSGRMDIVKEVPWERRNNSPTVTDTDENNLKMYLEENYELTSERVIKAGVDIVSNENKYHPIRDYLESLVWDGVPRIENMLPHFLGAEKSKYTIGVMKMHMLAAISRIYEPGIKYDIMLCLVGSQGAGKSTFFKYLAIKEEWFSDNLDHLDDENIYRKLQNHWIIEMGEMKATITAKNIEQIKSFLSRQKETYKVPYEVHPEDRPRQCVFCGTSNDLNFLPLDRTGNRRFAPVMTDMSKAVVHILDNEAESKAYIEQAWAEAMVLYRQGKVFLGFTKEIEEEAKAAGVDAFIAKPLFRSRLTATLRQFASGRKENTARNYLEKLSEADYTGKRILLVEDNELNREIGVEILQMTGAEVETAENGKIAVEKVEASPEGLYDLVFMDIQMPVMNGYEATAAIRSLPGEKGKLPIVAMTANAFAEDVQLAKNTGMNGHIAKPLDMNKLNDVLENWL